MEAGPPKPSVVAATAQLFDHLRAGKVQEAVQIATLFDHALTPKSARPGATAGSAATVHPLAVALRESGQVELAARYVQRYGLHACPVCSNGIHVSGQGGSPGESAAGTVARCVSCPSLPLHELVGDLVSAGNFDAVFRLSADARLARPPHSLGQLFPPPLLLSQALAQPRFEFVRGLISRKHWDLTKHAPLLRRWIIEEIEQSTLPDGTSSAMLKMAISGLLDGTQCQPESAALSAATALQLGSVSAATARMSLPEKYTVPRLLHRLAETDPKACLGLLRRWHPAVSPLPNGTAGDSLHRHAATANQRPSGSVDWRPADFGISPTSVIERLLHHDQHCSSGSGSGSSSSVAGRGPSSLVSQLCSVEFISHFGLQAAFPQVLTGLLAAGEVDSAVKFSHGGSQDCIKAQTITLTHVATTELLPIRLAASAAAPQITQTETRFSAATNDGQGLDGAATLRPGCTAALLAVKLNPTKKATVPIEEHMWTLQDRSSLRMSELQCSVVVVDCLEALCEAENVLMPLLRQAAAAILARTQEQEQADRKIRQQLLEMNADQAHEQGQEHDQAEELLEFEWPSPQVCGYPLLGLDTESPPVRKKGAASAVALLQVGSTTSTAIAGSNVCLEIPHLCLLEL